MRADELYKFSDGMLKSVRDTLHHRLLNFILGYNKGMPRRKWSATDQRRSGIMVDLIDKKLLERRIMRNLERLVGARELEMDYRLMQRIKRSKVRMGIMPTKTELALEQTQQGVSDEVLIVIMEPMMQCTTLPSHSRIYTDDGNSTSATSNKHYGSHEVFKLKNIKKDDNKSFQDEERFEHVGPKVTRSKEGERLQDDEEMMFD
ncbi:hypothetical protein Tco_1150135 [Tanacetum coccineum]